MKTAINILFLLSVPSVTLFASSPDTPTTGAPTVLDPQVLAAFAGAIFAGLCALVVGHVSHRRETRSRNSEWMRDKLFSIYSDAIYYLIKLSLSAPTNAPGNKDVRQHFSEAQRYLNLLRSYHSGNTGTTAKLRKCSEALAAASNQTTPLVEAADSALATVKEVFQADDRIRIDAK